MPIKTVAMVGLSDPGQQRAQNEDAIGVHPELGLAILADGMGGHQAGEVASGIAVEAIYHYFAKRLTQADTNTCQTMAEAIQEANGAIYEAGHTRLDREGMGSTVVVVTFEEGRLCVGHIGDSRLYRLRNGSFEQITKDHSVVQELVNRGIFTPEEARQSVAKNLVTRALGVDPVIEAEVLEAPTQDGDLYLLCSDGLNDVLADGQILETLNRHEWDLETAARELVDRANGGGGPDNISVILAQVGAAKTPPELDEI